MIWIALYLAVGLVVYWWAVRRYSHNPDDLLIPIYLFLEPFTFVVWLLWPIAIFAFKEEWKERIAQKERELKNKNEDASTKPLIGMIGKSITPLLPSGRIRLKERDYEAVAEFGHIEKGEQVKVVEISIGTLKVRRFQQDAPSTCGKTPPLSPRPHETQPPQ